MALLNLDVLAHFPPHSVPRMVNFKANETLRGWLLSFDLTDGEPWTTKG